MILAMIFSLLMSSEEVPSSSYKTGTSALPNGTFPWNQPSFRQGHGLPWDWTHEPLKYPKACPSGEHTKSRYALEEPPPDPKCYAMHCFGTYFTHFGWQLKKYDPATIVCCFTPIGDSTHVL